MKMDYDEYIEYHKQGDAGVEERTLANISKILGLSDWEKYKLIYYYTMTYNIPSALDMLLDGCFDMKKLNFRTDRRYVRCNGAYKRLLEELNKEKADILQRVKTSEQAYNVVSQWFFFGRYATFLFLEVYCNSFKPEWNFNLKYQWEPEENYTLGAEFITGTKDRQKLDSFLEQAKLDTQDNEFSIETSLCAVWKMKKGTRWNGFYTERMLEEAEKTKHKNLIYKAL